MATIKKIWDGHNYYYQCGEEIPGTTSLKEGALYMSRDMYDDLSKNYKVFKEDFDEMGKTKDEFFKPAENFWEENADLKHLDIEIKSFKDYMEYIYKNFLTNEQKQYIKKYMKQNMENDKKASLFPSTYRRLLLMFLICEKNKQREINSLEKVK